MADISKCCMTVRCSCGSVELEVSGTPITSAVCFCDDCQEGSRRIEALPNASVVRDPDGGTAYVLYRKDRVKFLRGESFLQAHKIREKSSTNRMVAACCNCAMILNFDDAKWWVDVYGARFQADGPPLRMRICTKFMTNHRDVPGDVPSYPTYPVRFVAKLLVAKIAMLFHR